MGVDGNHAHAHARARETLRICPEIFLRPPPPEVVASDTAKAYSLKVTIECASAP